MPEITLALSNGTGLHARPAALLVKTATLFACDIRISYDQSEANAKSVLSVLTLGAQPGAVVTVRAEGEDADEALKALKNLVESNFEVKD